MTRYVRYSPHDELQLPEDDATDRLLAKGPTDKHTSDTTIRSSACHHALGAGHPFDEALSTSCVGRRNPDATKGAAQYGNGRETR